MSPLTPFDFDQNFQKRCYTRKQRVFQKRKQTI